jgi:Uma2 family endonuclease
MAEAGVFGEDERVELLDGEIVAMSPIGPRHAWCVKRLVRTFTPLGDRVILSVQDPIRLDDRRAAQPDLALLRPGISEQRHPGPADVLLVVEVASSSLDVDRDVKALMYAGAGIDDFWIFDLIPDRLEVYRDPSPIGYRSIQVFERGQRVSPLFAPGLAVDVDAVLGPVVEP